MGLEEVSPELVLANQLARAKENAGLENRQARAFYEQAVSNWRLQVAAQRANGRPEDPPPIPRAEARVMLAEVRIDPWPPYQWPVTVYGPDLVDDPVKADAPPPPLPPGAIIAVGVHLHGKFWQAEQRDSVPEGFVIEPTARYPRLRKRTWFAGGIYEEV